MDYEERKHGWIEHGVTNHLVDTHVEMKHFNIVVVVDVLTDED